MFKAKHRHNLQSILQFLCIASPIWGLTYVSTCVHSAWHQKEACGVGREGRKRKHEGIGLVVTWNWDVPGALSESWEAFWHPRVQTEHCFPFLHGLLHSFLENFKALNPDLNQNV